MTAQPDLATRPHTIATPGRLSVWMPGPPPTQGSMRPIVTRSGKPRLLHDQHDRLAQWRADLRAVLAELPDDQARLLPLHGPLMLGVAVALPRPARHRRRSGALSATAPRYPTTRPDLDKIVRAVCDALTIAAAWEDDRQITNLYASKTYADDPLEVGVDILARRPATL